ncbi:MAG TPA: hypothetical protein VES69_05925 [Pyrinomonadaceae bacterium]|nr:hypothetical protein [Pyrinomonadaceae bacterium]
MQKAKATIRRTPILEVIACSVSDAIDCGIDQQSIRMICQATGIREFHIGRSAREPAAATGVVRSERVKALIETAQESC